MKDPARSKFRLAWAVSLAAVALLVALAVVLCVKARLVRSTFSSAKLVHLRALGKAA